MDGIPESDESWIMKHWILTTIFVIIIIAIISGILTFKYSSPEGIIKGPLSDTNKALSQTICPQLSNQILEGFDQQANAWVLERVDYKTKNEEVVFAEPPSDKEDGTKIFFCDLGKNEGQNPNYVYCGDFIRPIVLYKLDAGGNKIDNSKNSIEIVFDSKTKKYISTNCGTYDAVNAP